MKHIAFVGGGSGGHIQPIASLIDYAKQYTNIATRSKRYRFGQVGGLEQSYAEKYDEVTFVGVATGKLRRYWTLHSTLQNLRDIVLTIIGFFQSVYLLKKHSIDVIFCKGGFVCPPVAYAGRLLGIPVMMHESDTHLGLANRMILPIASQVFVGYAGVRTDEKIVGQILSPMLLQDSSFELPGLDPHQTTTLVMGGSQGAKVLFDEVYRRVKTKERGQGQYIFVLGSKNSNTQYAISGQIWTVGFVDQDTLAQLYRVCDCSITRGSANALQEQHLFGLCKAIIPLPYTGGDHQTTNAKYYEQHYQDVWIPEDDTMREGLDQFVRHHNGRKKTHKEPTVDELCHASIIVWKVILNNK